MPDPRFFVEQPLSVNARVVLPAAVAHHARTIAMSDPQQLKALIETERPDVVVPEIEAIATPIV